MSNMIVNPFGRGQAIVIPKGTLIQAHNTLRLSGSSNTVVVWHSLFGWINSYGGGEMGRGFVIRPQITFAVSGGYWHNVQITEALCDANSVPMPALPDYDDRCLDVIPSYDKGYSDLWNVSVAA